MTEAQMQLLILRGIEAEMPDEQRAELRRCREQLREVIAAHEDLGKFAAVCVCAELAAEAV